MTANDLTALKHTPGPWRDCEPGSNFAKGKKFIRPVSCEQLIATICSEGRFSERNANARLIAAAPDLLAALKELMNHYGNHGDGFSEAARLQARTAIAKATAP